jgi:uncharacterized protein (TIGR01777 family)
MKVVVTGGTGFIGTRLIEELLGAGHQVVVLTRHMSENLPVAVRQVVWDGKTHGPWAGEIDGAEGVINLAGEPIAARRWTEAQKHKILSSRIDATEAVVEAIRRAPRRPAVLINASAVGIYGDVPEGTVTEDHPPGKGFLADTCSRWEAQASAAKALGVRVAIMRTGIVLGDGGGALEKMLLPFRLFVGGPLGSGRQGFPWVHRDDAVGAILYVLSTPAVDGPVNISAPETLTMAQFCSILGHVLHRPSWLPVPSLILRIVLGEMSAVVLSGQKIIPRKLLDLRYNFKYPNAMQALKNIFS